MGAPPTPAVAMGFPTGIKLDDGYQTIIHFAEDPNVSLWEKSVKPPGLDAGDPIDTTTMRNATWRTQSPRALVTLTEMTIVAAYDPVMYDRAVGDLGGAVSPGGYPGLLNVPTTITVEFPDSTKLAFYGYMRLFEPQDHEEGTQPTANVTIVPTNQDPSDGSEQPPVIESYGTA